MFPLHCIAEILRGKSGDTEVVTYALNKFIIRIYFLATMHALHTDNDDRRWQTARRTKDSTFMVGQNLIKCTVLRLCHM